MSDSKHATRAGSRVIPLLFALNNMVEVECPSCGETVDLGIAEEGTYECPYCEDDFYWENHESDLWDEIDSERYSHEEIASRQRMITNGRKVKEFLKKRRTRKDFKFPLRIGNLKARRELHTEWITIALVFTFIGFFQPIIILQLGACYALFIIIRILYLAFKFLQRKRGFSEGVLDPEFLRGTGLVIFPDFSAKLVAKSWIPAYQFEEDDIDKIVLHETIFSGLRSSNNFELFVHLHGFHALTLYGFNEDDSIDIVHKLMSVYDIDLDCTSQVIVSSGGDGGGGGGG